MAASKLDQIVKGAPPSSTLTPEALHPPPQAPVDPLSTLPSSPPQIYLNLLILEASLRSQYLTLRARRRQHTFFLFLLTAWIACFFYALFLRPREDGRGVGGSVYWVVETAEKVALMGGVVTGILVWGTGQWERGVRWPRRWVGVANRGLRGINSKLVIIKGPWWSELFSTLSIIFPYSSFFQSQGSSYHYVPHLNELPKRATPAHMRANPSISQSSSLGATYEEDLAPGGDYVKLLLLPKPFSPAFRENWEAFRSEYWENENERRALLLVKLRQRERELAKLEGGWLWWTGWRGWTRSRSDVEKNSQSSHHQHGHHQHPHHRATHLDTKTSRPNSMYRSGSHSRNSSRSTTPTYDLDDKPSNDDRRRRRRSSTTSNSSRTSANQYEDDQQMSQKVSQQQSQNKQQNSSKRRSKTSGTAGSLRSDSVTAVSTRDRPLSRVGSSSSSSGKNSAGGKGAGSGGKITRLTPADPSKSTDNLSGATASVSTSSIIRRESSMQSLSSGNESDRSGTSSVLDDARPSSANSTSSGRGAPFSSSSFASANRDRGARRS